MSPNFQNFGIALESMFLRSTDRCQFADVLFRLDDGVLAAHRAILMARCDMMNAMFAHKGGPKKTSEESNNRNFSPSLTG